MLSKSLRRAACAYVCQSCLSRGIAPSYTVARRYNHVVSASESASNSHTVPQLNGVNTKSTKNESQKTEGATIEQSKKQERKNSVADSTDEAKNEGDLASKAKKKRSRKRRGAGKLNSSKANRHRSKTKDLPTDSENAAKVEPNTEDVGENILGITSKPKIELKKFRSKIITALKHGKPADKLKSDRSKDRSEETKRVRSATVKFQNDIRLKDVEILALNTESDEVPELSYGLDRVLFNPGVYQLQDPRTMVYNFDPYLREIMPVSEFDFEALNDYITSSKDDLLREKAKEAGKKYIGSSSSMTSVLSHFHFLLSEWRDLNLSNLTRSFPGTSKSFTKLTRLPAVVFLRYKDGVYGIDADKEWDTSNILMGLGKSMEKLLTMPSDQFERFRRSNAEKILKEDTPPEVYHYSACENFLMRSQLDARDSRLPGTGMFDLKTRAVVSIRMESRNPGESIGYQIKSRHGEFESFEREYFDMMRSAFLKYHLQVRIGRMDGIFVAYHNIKRIFGFQYIPLSEMDSCIHGQQDTALGDAEFKLSLGIWNKVLDIITETYPEQSLRLHFETRETQNPFMYIFAEPMNDDEITKIQERNLIDIEAYERKHFYPELLENNKVEQEVGKGTDPKVQQPETAQSASDKTASGDEAGSSTEEPTPRRPLLAMALSIRNLVNGTEVDRPYKFTSNDNWDVKYQISTFSEERGWALYEACKLRRSKALAITEEDESPNTVYHENLKSISKDGQKWRDMMDAIEQMNGIIRYES